MVPIGPMVSAAPAPKPAAVMPAAKPRLPGNHFSALPTQVPYTHPVPMPPSAAPKYSMGKELATEFSAQADPTNSAPANTTQRGPNRSTKYPSTGISHVSMSTNKVTATWIGGRPQGYFASIGLTNRVQPYCRFATAAMHMTPIMSCTQGFANGDFAVSFSFMF